MRNKFSYHFSRCFKLSSHSLCFSHIVPSIKGSVGQIVTLFTSMQLQLANGNILTQGQLIQMICSQWGSTKANLYNILYWLSFSGGSRWDGKSSVWRPRAQGKCATWF